MIYQARLNLANNNPNEAIKILKSFKVENLDLRKTSNNKATPDRLIQEMAAYLYAKALISNQDTFSEGKNKLTILAKNGELVAAEAIITLLRIAQTESDKASSIAIAKEAMAIKPALNELVAQELSNMGVQYQ